MSFFRKIIDGIFKGKKKKKKQQTADPFPSSSPTPSPSPTSIPEKEDPVVEAPKDQDEFLFEDPFGDTQTPVEPSKPPVSNPTPTPDPTPTPTPTNGAQTLRVNYEEGGAKATVTNGTLRVTFTERQYGQTKGWRYLGTQGINDFLNNHPQLLEPLNINRSSINVLLPTVANEGNFEAINSYDSAFFSFGIFQWTLGRDDRAGELPILLGKIKESFPDTFNTYFRSAGIDVIPYNQSSGFLSLHGNKIDRPAEKEQFRSPEWAFRFWQAGLDPKVQAVQLDLARSRLKTFYWDHRYAVSGYQLSQLITSEYGVSLILDNHVNRPAFVQPCVQLAFDQAGLTGDPITWTTSNELSLLRAYLQIRRTYEWKRANGDPSDASPMTHAEERELKTKEFLNQGLISAARNSFVYDASPAS